MDFITSNIKQLYQKYLVASVASALVMSVYSFVDTIAVGQAEGPNGTAAMAVITPLYGVLIFIAILCGVGGSVLLSTARGEGNSEKGNAYFTASVLLIGILTVVMWISFAIFHEEIFTLFGADDSIMSKVMEYADWIIRFFPVFIAPSFIGAFIRNDGAPNLVMAAVIIGGSINIIGDWFFVFPLGMGMAGAAVATVLGTSMQFAIMCSHFFTKRCNLCFVKPYNPLHALQKIISIGFGASVLDLGTVVLSILMNNQIMRYGNTTALAVYGVIATITSLFQALFCGVGQAIQPIVSANYGAKEKERIRSVWKMSFATVSAMGIVFTAIGEFLPKQIARLFIAVTPEVLAVAPQIIRPFFTLFLFLGVTVLSTYYLQSSMRGRMSMIIALLRSIVLSGLFIFILPTQFGITGVWTAMPLSELIVAIISLCYIRKNMID